MKKRDYNILLHLRGEINLGTKTVKDRKKYSRKMKHKSKGFDKVL